MIYSFGFLVYKELPKGSINNLWGALIYYSLVFDSCINRLLSTLFVREPPSASYSSLDYLILQSIICRLG